MEEAGQTLAVRRGYRPTPVVLGSVGGLSAVLKSVEIELGDADMLLHPILPEMGRREVGHRILGYHRLHREAQAALQGMVVLELLHAAAKKVDECQLIMPDDVCTRHLQKDRQVQERQEQEQPPVQVYVADRSLHRGQISSECRCRNALEQRKL